MATHTDRAIRVRSIGVLQIGCIGGLLAVIPAIIGAVAMFVVFSGSPSLFSSGSSGMVTSFSFIGLGLVLVAYPVLGFIGGCIYALLYNLAGAITGGLEIEVR